MCIRDRSNKWGAVHTLTAIFGLVVQTLDQQQDTFAGVLLHYMLQQLAAGALAPRLGGYSQIIHQHKIFPDVG